MIAPQAVARVEETVPGVLALSDRPRNTVWPPLRKARQKPVAVVELAVDPVGILPSVVPPT